MLLIYILLTVWVTYALYRWLGGPYKVFWVWHFMPEDADFTLQFVWAWHPYYDQEPCHGLIVVGRFSFRISVIHHVKF